MSIEGDDATAAPQKRPSVIGAVAKFVAGTIATLAFVTYSLVSCAHDFGVSWGPTGQDAKCRAYQTQAKDLLDQATRTAQELTAHPPTDVVSYKMRRQESATQASSAADVVLNHPSCFSDDDKKHAQEIRDTLAEKPA